MLGKDGIEYYVGDMVECVDAVHGLLLVGNKYEVFDSCDGPIVHAEDGEFYSFNADRFVLAD